VIFDGSDKQLAPDDKIWFVKADWGEVTALLRDPPEFVRYAREVLGRQNAELGDTGRFPVITLLAGYALWSAPMQNQALLTSQTPDSRYDVLVGGKRASNVLWIRVLNRSEATPDAAELQSEEPIRVVLDANTMIGHAHYRLPERPDIAAQVVSQLIRNPMLLLEIANRGRIVDDEGRERTDIRFTASNPGALSILYQYDTQSRRGCTCVVSTGSLMNLNGVCLIDLDSVLVSCY
jgi:hypothetical protein